MKTAYTPARELFAYRRHEAVLYVMAAYALWLLPALFAAVMMSSDDTGLLRWPAIVVLEVLAGFGAFAVAGIAHEGLHGNLSADRQRSAVFGALLSAPIVGFYAPGFYVLHARHHRFVNTGRDPVAMHYTKFTGVLGRLFLARVAEGPRYFVETLRLLRRTHERLDAFVPFETLRRTAMATIVMKIGLIGGVVALGITAPLIVVSVVLIPAAFSVLIASCVPFLEHAQTDAAPAVRSARSHTSPLMTLLRLGANFHLPHHLFPAIPCWRLGRVQAQLAAAEPQSVAAVSDRTLADLWRTLRRREWRIAVDEPNVRSHPTSSIVPTADR
jgi:beta-carotene hydroxylase